MPTVDLRALFLKLQKEMEASLSTTQEIPHPTGKGEATEMSWIDMLKKYLPKRYQVEKAFVVDSDSQLSEQIDIVIFDSQYSPFLLNHEGALYVSAESVYSIIEVKPKLDKAYIEYAGKKAASVRRLRRTSAKIPHAGGVFAPRELFEIPAGVVALESDWNPPFGEKFQGAVSALKKEERIDFGCALRHGSFDIDYSDSSPKIGISSPESSLIFLFLTLLSRLQILGTVPAIEFDKYAKALSVK
ncbi:MAG: DUF6602 domain-containing protein [Candidatus Bathyarchaeia archaeon]|jgi:hypothetical protein